MFLVSKFDILKIFLKKVIDFLREVICKYNLYFDLFIFDLYDYIKVFFEEMKMCFYDVLKIVMKFFFEQIVKDMEQLLLLGRDDFIRELEKKLKFEKCFLDFFRINLKVDEGKWLLVLFIVFSD